MLTCFAGTWLSGHSVGFSYTAQALIYAVLSESYLWPTHAALTGLHD